MTLRQRQIIFARLAAALIEHAFQMGYEVTLAEAYRDPRAPWGHPSSLHHSRLAIDLNLFRDGRYLNSTKAHEPLGLWWEAQHELARWGGRFKDSRGKPKPDGNHYSLAHDGRA